MTIILKLLVDLLQICIYSKDSTIGMSSSLTLREFLDKMPVPPLSPEDLGLLIKLL